MVDFYALRAREPRYLLDLFDSLDDRKFFRLLPNMVFGRALAMLAVETEDDQVRVSHTRRRDTRGWADAGGRRGCYADAVAPVMPPRAPLLSSSRPQPHVVSSRLLVDAMVLFPSVLTALADACKVTLPARALRHPLVTAYAWRRGTDRGQEAGPAPGDLPLYALPTARLRDGRRRRSGLCHPRCKR